MEVQELQSKFSPHQELYIQYLASGKQDTTGKKWKKEEFAKLVGVDPATLWRWERIPGFQAEVFERSMKRLTEFIPSMNRAMVRKALEKGDVAAYMAIMRQANLLKSDKIESRNENYDQITYKFSK